MMVIAYRSNVFACCLYAIEHDGYFPLIDPEKVLPYVIRTSK